jgi:MarR family transcriptional regulator, lower aerobic nicotinate degradation pathway regulator
MEAARSVMDSLRRLVHGLRVFDRAAERTAGLSGAQLFVLARLAAGGAASVNELAERTCTHQSSVSVVARKLVGRGLARSRRAERDGRKVELTITPAGRRALARAPAAAQEKLIDAIGCLNLPDRLKLAQLLQSLIDAAGLTEAPAALFFEAGREKQRTSNHHARTPR